MKLISSHIDPEQVTELTLSDDENHSGMMEFFLSKFSINTFVCLRSLTLIQINNEEFMNQILIAIADRRTLPNFSSLKILNSDENYGDIFLEIIMSILTKPSLREVYFDLSYSRTTSNPLPWFEESSIQHLTFEGTCTVHFIRNTLICVPQLQTLKLDDFDFDEEVDLNSAPPLLHDDDETSDIDEEEVAEIPPHDENLIPRKEQFASMDSPNHLKSLVLSACTIPMSKLEWMLEDMPMLKHLCLITTSLYDDEAILDGQRWENLLINLDKFEFVFLVNLSIDSKWNADMCIDKFQRPFWLEKKQWFVSLEKYDEEILVYSLPYRNKFFVMKNEFSSFEYRSTASENPVLQSQSMSKVNELYIDTSVLKIPPLDVR